MNASEPLPLETYALALAHILRHRSEPVATVLGALNISAEAFQQAEEHWTQELAQSLVRRKGMLAMKFAAAFAEARTEVGLLDPTAGEALPHAPAPDPATPALPTYLQRQQETSPSREHQTSPVFAARMELLPFLPGAPAPVPPATREPPQPPEQRRDNGTAPIDPEARRQAVTPWEAAPGGAALPLSIEGYAALNVELAQPAADYRAILARYELRSAEEHQRIDAGFNALFHQRPALRAQYDALIAHYTSLVRR